MRIGSVSSNIHVSLEVNNERNSSAAEATDNNAPARQEVHETASHPDGLPRPPGAPQGAAGMEFEADMDSHGIDGSGTGIQPLLPVFHGVPAGDGEASVHGDRLAVHLFIGDPAVSESTAPMEWPQHIQASPLSLQERTAPEPDHPGSFRFLPLTPTGSPERGVSTPIHSRPRLHVPAAPRHSRQHASRASPYPNRRIGHAGSQGTRLDFDAHAPARAAPSVIFSERPSLPPLENCAAAWFAAGTPGQAAARDMWSAFGNEEGADEFRKFLHSLSTGNVNTALGDYFRTTVAGLLTRMARSPELRRDIFLHTIGASQNCEDRRTKTLNDMAPFLLTHDVRSGEFDRRIPDFISSARQLFRREVVSEIALKKSNSLMRELHPASGSRRSSYREGLAVALYFETKLNIRLNLGLYAPEMCWGMVVNVSAEELDRAVREVQRQEHTGFAEYFCGLPAWHSLIGRLTPDMQPPLDERLDSARNTFEERLASRLEENGLGDIPDARIRLGRQVMIDIDREFWRSTTEEVLHRPGTDFWSLVMPDRRDNVSPALQDECKL
jgi:hypothetical protein